METPQQSTSVNVATCKERPSDDVAKDSTALPTKVHGASKLSSAFLCVLMIVVTLVIKFTDKLVPKVSYFVNF